MVAAARQAGSSPYVVEGFFEVTDAVRRGHSVVLRRETCEVADGIVVFAAYKGEVDDVVTITGFDVRTARYTISDPHTAMGSVELTPRRLQTYLMETGQELGVALAA